MNDIREITIDNTIIEVEVEGDPRPSLASRALIGAGAIGLVFPLVGIPVLFLGLLVGLLHRISERERIDALCMDVARQAYFRHEQTAILAYKSLG